MKNYVIICLGLLLVTAPSHGADQKSSPGATVTAYYKAIGAEDAPALENLLIASSHVELCKVLLTYTVVFDATEVEVTSVKIKDAEVFGTHALVRTEVQCKISDHEGKNSHDGGGKYAILLIKQDSGWKIRKVMRAAIYDAHAKALIYKKALNALGKSKPVAEPKPAK